MHGMPMGIVSTEITLLPLLRYNLIAWLLICSPFCV
jgi:hypothetical protein